MEKFKISWFPQFKKVNTNLICIDIPGGREYKYTTKIARFYITAIYLECFNLENKAISVQVNKIRIILKDQHLHWKLLSIIQIFDITEWTVKFLLESFIFSSSEASL